MRFKLDENLPYDLAQFLTGIGHDAETVKEEGLSGYTDEDLLPIAYKENRIFLTFDLDFADTREYPPGSHSGIMVFRLHDQRWKILERVVRNLFHQVDFELLKGGLAIMDEIRIRYHHKKNNNV